jgi:hypothetical protein
MPRGPTCRPPPFRVGAHASGLCLRVASRAVAALPLARARALKVGVPLGTVWTPLTARRLARPPWQRGSEADRAAATVRRLARLARWATSLPCAQASPSKIVGRVCCANGLRWHCGRRLHVTQPLGRGGFGPLAVELFFYFLNIFKFLQIQKFM